MDFKENKREKRSSELIRIIEEVSSTVATSKTKNTLKFFIGQVTSINSDKTRAKVKMPQIGSESEYELLDIEATIKTLEIINVGDSVIVMYIYTVMDSYIMAKFSTGFETHSGGSSPDIIIDTSMPSDPQDDHVLSTKWIYNNIYTKSVISALLEQKVTKVDEVEEDSIYAVNSDGEQIVIPISELDVGIREVQVNGSPLEIVDGGVNIPMNTYLSNLYKNMTYDFENARLRLVRHNNDVEFLDIEDPKGINFLHFNTETKILMLVSQDNQSYTVDLSSLGGSVDVDNTTIIQDSVTNKISAIGLKNFLYVEDGI